MSVEIDVSQSDQEKISEFAQLAEHAKALKAERRALADHIDLLDEISGEIMLSDDLRLQSGEGLRFQVADVFLELDQDEHDALVEEDLANAKAKRQAIAAELAQVEDKQAQLKSELYLRFGTQIALESDD